MILSMLVEGMSMRSISRTLGVSINTVTKLLVDRKSGCATSADVACDGPAAEIRPERWGAREPSTLAQGLPAWLPGHSRATEFLPAR